MSAFKDFIVRRDGGCIVARHRDHFIKPWKGKNRVIAALVIYCAKRNIHPKVINADGGVARAIKWERL